MDILEPFVTKLGRYFVPRASGCLERVDCGFPTCRGELHCPEAFILLVLDRKRKGFRHRSRGNSGNFVHVVFQLPGCKLEKSENF
jgi:hypothetical protein